MKELIYIPVIHTQDDMGTMAYSLKMEYVAKYGKKKWQQHIKAIDDMWKGLHKKIFSLNLPYRRTRIYQDSLPVCGKELEMVRDMVAIGSMNHKIILELVKKGAKLEGTEDPGLLLQEYSNIKMLYQAADIEEKIKAGENYRKVADELIIKRDRFIAKKIENTLSENEIGILFAGIQHNVNKYLINFKISYLIHRLPFKESYETTTIK